MLGLVHREKVHGVKTTVEKALFLIKHIPNLHGPTAAVAFGALGALVVLKYLKGQFKSAWIRGVPEVLIVVFVSTCSYGKFPGFSALCLLTGSLEPQTFLRSFTGTKVGSIFSALCPSTSGHPSSLFL
jgi:hypothetical protein